MNEDGYFVMGRDDVNYAIYVAQDPETKLYLKGVLRFLTSGEGWMKNASVDEIKEQLAFVASRRPIWTQDINDADIWSKYYINQCSKYLPPIEFVKVSLCTSESQ